MNFIRSLMGRRQFIVGAVAASAYGMASKKMTKAFSLGAGENSGMFADTASAAESFTSAHTEGNTGNRYSHLLSPLKIRNVILKNRILYAVSNPHYLQGPEKYPADAIRSYYANIAKGAGIVTCRIAEGGLPREKRTGDSAHMMIYDEEDPSVQNYIDQLVEGVHCYGALVCAGRVGGGPLGVVSAGIDAGMSIVDSAKKLEDRGVDMTYMGGLSKMAGEREIDAFKEQVHAVKSATRLIIGMSMMVKDPDTRPEFGDSHSRSAYSLEEGINLSKTLEDTIDILFIKASSGSNNHSIGFNQEQYCPVVLNISQAMKSSGTKMVLAPNGGFRYPDRNDQHIASGKADIIAMARPFLADPDLGTKMYEGRQEDVIPCIMCNKCHGLSMTTGPYYSICSVNPQLGIGSAVRTITPPTSSKKVAVIGGGPAGMKAALTAAERGHRVTLYEQNGCLGGLLRHADYSPYKWPLKEYKDYLVLQIQKSGIEVLLNTKATPDMVRAKGYDAVLAAVGANPFVPRIPGADGDNVWNVMDVYGNKKSLGKKVVFVGGGEFGLETAMYLAKIGHKVTVLTSAKELITRDQIHYHLIVIDTCDFLEGFDFITEAVVTGISKGSVAYTDGEGSKKSIKADDVVVYSGLKPMQDEALSFSGAARHAFFPIGDCTGNAGNVQKTIRNAFFVASQI